MIAYIQYIYNILFPPSGGLSGTPTAQNMKFSIKDFFSKCDQIRSFLMI